MSQTRRAAVVLAMLAGSAAGWGQAGDAAGGASPAAQPSSEGRAASSARPVNRVFFGQDLFIPKGQQIHDATCVFCSIQVEGEVTGRVLILFGNLSITGRVGEGVTIVDGNAVFDAQSRVAGNTVVLAGNAVYETEDVLSGSAYVLGGHSSSFGAKRGLRRRLALSPKLLSTFVLLGCVLLLAAAAGVRQRRLHR